MEKEEAPKIHEADKPTEAPAKDISNNESTTTHHVHHDELTTLPTEDKAQNNVASAQAPVVSKNDNIFKRFGRWIKHHKIWSAVIFVVVILGVLAAIPWTRYTIAGLFIKQTYNLNVTDSQTGKAVTAASVALAGHVTQTDNQGHASLKAPVGKRQLTIGKKYYQTLNQQILVPIGKQKTAQNISLQATGRPITVTIVNKVTGAGLANATIKALGTEATTDKQGQADMVLPADQSKVDVTIEANGYNSQTSQLVVVNQQIADNHFSLTPSGKIYFLSNLSGKIDVVKTNLDGSDRQTVLAGTGKEDKQTTALLASRDWKYLALLSKRAGGDNPKLYLIDTSTDKTTTIDEGNVNFTLSGWSNHSFIYTILRNDVSYWQPKQSALKSFNADSRKTTTLDETSADGDQHDYASNVIGTAYEVNDQVIYTISWSGYEDKRAGKQSALVSVHADGSSKKTIKNYDAKNIDSIQTALYEPGSIYIKYYQSTDEQITESYSYEDDQVKSVANVPDSNFNSYPTYLVSPSGKHTFWSDQRDGKNTLFVGDDEGKNSKQVMSIAGYQTYGWYSDDYLLVSKDSSELYILPTTGLVGDKPMKITDYYKPAQTFRGYGGGYGGL